MSADTWDWVNYTGGAGSLTGPHESCRQDRSVGGPSSLQSLTTSAGLSTPPGRVEAEDAHISESTISWGPCMVVVSNPSLSQQAGHHLTPLWPYSQDGYIVTRLGCNLQGQHNRGTLECGRAGAAHQLSGTQSGISCVEIIPGSRGSGSNSLLGPAPSTSYSAGNRQHNSGYLCEQERGNADSHNLSPSLGPVVFSSGKGLMGHSPSPTRPVECRSRCSLEGVQCAYRVDASEGCFQAHNASLLSSTDRPLCISSKPPGAPLPAPPSRSGVISSGRFSAGLESMEEFHPSTSCTTASHSSESEGRQSYSLAGSPRLAGAAVVCSIQLMLMGAPYRLPKERTLLSLPFDREAIHPLWRSLNLTVWPISGKPARQLVSPRKWLQFFWHPGPSHHRSVTRVPGECGVSGAPPGAFAPFQHQSLRSWPSWQSCPRVGPWSTGLWQSTSQQYLKGIYWWVRLGLESSVWYLGSWKVSLVWSHRPLAWARLGMLSVC